MLFFFNFCDIKKVLFCPHKRSNEVIGGTDMSEDIALKPFDIVFVRRASIANVDIWVDQGRSICTQDPARQHQHRLRLLSIKI